MLITYLTLNMSPPQPPPSHRLRVLQLLVSDDDGVLTQQGHHAHVSIPHHILHRGSGQLGQAAALLYIKQCDLQAQASRRCPSSRSCECRQGLLMLCGCSTRLLLCCTPDSVTCRHSNAGGTSAQGLALSSVDRGKQRPTNPRTRHCCGATQLCSSCSS